MMMMNAKRGLFQRTQHDNTKHTDSAKTIGSMALYADSTVSLDADLQFVETSTRHTRSLSASSSSSSGKMCCEPCLKKPNSARSLKECAVRFSDIEVHKHAIILGDSPSVSAGPPIAIAWEECDKPEKLSVDQYEDASQHRRIGRELVVSRNEREARLSNAGYSRGEMKKAAREARKLQNQALRRMNKENNSGVFKHMWHAVLGSTPPPSTTTCQA